MFITIKENENYRIALQEINRALIQQNYHRTLEFKTYYEGWALRNGLDEHRTKLTSNVKDAVAHASTDVLIELVTHYTDPKGDPKNRWAEIRLKAVDKYTSEILAISGSIRSYTREFPDFTTALTHAITKDGHMEFIAFLKQLDLSLERIIAEGRIMYLKFEIDIESDQSFYKRVQNRRIQDWIDEIVKENAFRRNYKLMGSSKDYISYELRTQVLDEQNQSLGLQPILNRIDDKLYAIGIDSEYTTLHNWINFVIID